LGERFHLADNGEVQQLLKQAADPVGFPGPRGVAIATLRQKYPEIAASNKVEIARWEASVKKADRSLQDAASKSQAINDADDRKSGVHLGMSKAQVLRSQWGKPSKIHATHSELGDTEQWVYQGGYLYFRDGVLTSVQN
jgi:hypothetical protein